MRVEEVEKMLHTIESVNSVINDFIWGVPAMICIIGVGLYLSIRTGFLQSAMQRETLSVARCTILRTDLGKIGDGWRICLQDLAC